MLFLIHNLTKVALMIGTTCGLKWNYTFGTRNAMRLHVKRARTCIDKKTAKIQGAEIFNGLPKDITNCKTVKNFRKSLKRHIIHSYIT